MHALKYILQGGEPMNEEQEERYGVWRVHTFPETDVEGEDRDLGEVGDQGGGQFSNVKS